MQRSVNTTFGQLNMRTCLQWKNCKVQEARVVHNSVNTAEDEAGYAAKNCRPVKRALAHLWYG
jgi:hypothetical protein